MKTKIFILKYIEKNVQESRPRQLNIVFPSKISSIRGKCDRKTMVQDERTTDVFFAVSCWHKLSDGGGRRNSSKSWYKG